MNVPKGISTYIGFIAGGGLLVLLPMIAALADALTPFGVPVQTWVYVGAAITAVTIAGRMYQAATMSRGPGAGVEQSPEPMPVEPTDVAL